jgi:hypothetical protein
MLSRKKGLQMRWITHALAFIALSIFAPVAAFAGHGEDQYPFIAAVCEQESNGDTLAYTEVTITLDGSTPQPCPEGTHLFGYRVNVRKAPGQPPIEASRAADHDEEE